MGRVKMEQGFSLIELMVVVTITAILTAIAIPNYRDFVRRARFSEAKANLSAMYFAQKAYMAEHQMYTSIFNSLGFAVDGRLQFNIGFDNNAPAAPMAFAGTPSCTRTCPVSNCPNTYVTWQCLAAASESLDGRGDALVTSNTFKVGAHSHFTSDANDWFTFTMDQNRRLEFVFPGY